MQFWIKARTQTSLQDPAEEGSIDGNQEAKIACVALESTHHESTAISRLRRHSATPFNPPPTSIEGGNPKEHKGKPDNAPSITTKLFSGKAGHIPRAYIAGLAWQSGHPGASGSSLRGTLDLHCVGSP